MPSSERAEVDRELLIERFEKLMEEKKYPEARAVLEELLEHDPKDRVGRLYALLDSVRVQGAAAVESEIQQLQALNDLTAKERESVRQIFLAAFGEAEKEGDPAKARLYEELLRKLAQADLSGEASGDASAAAAAGAEALPSRPGPADASSSAGSRAFLKQPRLRWALSAAALSVLALVAINELASNYRSRDSKEEAVTETKPARPLLSSPALDSLVIGPKDLGFHLSGAEGDEQRRNGFARSVEHQLINLRQLYRQEAAKKPELMGAMVIQITIDASGAVTRVDETASGIQDPAFRKAVAEEARKWKFAELPGPARIDCPLLFIPAGMDTTTLIKWEQAQGLLKQTREPTRVASATPARPAPPQEKPARASPNVKAADRTLAAYRVRTTTFLRSEPRFAAPRMEKLEPGAVVRLRSVKGDWLEVQRGSGGTVGFMRREYAVAVEKPDARDRTQRVE